MDESNPETETEATSIPEQAPAEPPGPRLVAMIEHDGREIPRGYPERNAEAAWAAVSALWHPAILARLDTLPTTAGVEFPDVPEPREIRVIAEGAGAPLPADYRTIGEGSGAILLDGGIDRAEIVRSVLRAMGSEAELDLTDPIAQDFLALGTARWFLRDLTNAMGHADNLDIASLTREAIAGAKAWASGDASAASGHLRAAFEVLTQARERFYPVDAYIVDVCLIDPSFPRGALADPLSARAPVTFLGTARAVERIAEVDPERLAALREAINEGWVDVIGGTYDEIDESLAPLNSIAWQFLKGAETYRRHIDERNVETLATRRFALYPQRPQIARRFGFRFAMHVGFDAGRFPIPRETKRLWESPDSSHLESLMRPPIAADRASEGLRLPWRIGRSMKDDHVATLSMAHWPSPVAGWYRDLRRVAAYSPVLSRWVTMGDYFHMSDRPWEMYAPNLDEYESPYLAQSVGRGSLAPISARVEHARERAALDAATALDALTRALLALPVLPPSEMPSHRLLTASDRPFAQAEEALETGRIAEAQSTIASELTRGAKELAEAIVGAGAPQAGSLVLNPTGASRRVAVIPPGEASPTMVDLAPFGFAWLAGHDGSRSVEPAASAAGLTLSNGVIEVEVDRTTGGLRSVRSRGEETPRLGQQLVISGLVDASGEPAASHMESDSVEVTAAGPVLAEIVSRGRIVHPATGAVLAQFRQTVQLWSGRPIAELSIDLESLDPEWSASIASADPWAKHLACRWAWPDRDSGLRRTHLMGVHATKSPRPETSEALEVVSRTHRTTLLCGGLAHHRRHGDRMLDTLLIAGREASRSFRLGITLDQDHAHAAADDFLAPAPVVASASPPAGPAGWLLIVESRAIRIARVEFLEPYGEEGGAGLAILLQETAGRAVRSRLRLFRDPKEARQTDFAGEILFDLAVEGDAVPVDLTPYEMIRVEIRLS